MIQHIIKNINSGLFNQDKQIFIFLYAVMIFTESNPSFQIQELEYFSKGFKGPFDHHALPQGLKVSQEAWNAFVSLRMQLPEYIPITRDIEQHPKAWSKYLNASTMVTDTPPCEITPFNKLILNRLFQPSEVIRATHWFIES